MGLFERKPHFSYDGDWDPGMDYPFDDTPQPNQTEEIDLAAPDIYGDDGYEYTAQMRNAMEEQNNG